MNLGVCSNVFKLTHSIVNVVISLEISVSAWQQMYVYMWYSLASIHTILYDDGETS